MNYYWDFKAVLENVINPFPHNKILDQTEWKAFAEDKLNVTKMIISVFDRGENMVGKGEIACTSLIKILSQQSTNVRFFFYHITESSELR